MLRDLLVTALGMLMSLSATAQLFGDGPQLKSLSEFSDGKFQFESVKSVYWSHVINEGSRFVARAEKVWVPSRLYMPASTAAKVPAVVVMHGIGGLYTRDGQKRPYWEYAELLAANGIAALVVDSHGARGLGVTQMLASTEVSVYTFIADAFIGADMLRSNSRIDPDQIGVMGFSKGGMTALLAADRRFVNAFSRTLTPFALHIPIYPG